MSRFQPSDSAGGGDSRRSPRDRSPARYNDRRDSLQYNNTPARDADRHDRSSSGSRVNSNAFLSDRDRFRDPGREPQREFPNRDPPRGPKALADIPSGPRASSFSNDYRSRGRARGRGFHDDSRDRGRENERDFRDRWDDRGAPAFRDDRGRGRDWDDGERGDRSRRESMRGRRPSPPVRSRSPPRHEMRDNWERRDSRDLPGDLQANSRGDYGRGRGRGRADWDIRDGRGRGSLYPGQSRSPERDRRDVDVAYAARPVMSRSPPPQAPEVPAFGSVPTGPRADRTVSDRETVTEGPVSRPIPSVSASQVPTAPKSYLTPMSSRTNGRVTGNKWVRPSSPEAILQNRTGNFQSPNVLASSSLDSAPQDNAAIPQAPPALHPAFSELITHSKPADIAAVGGMANEVSNSTQQNPTALIQRPTPLATVIDEQPVLAVLEAPIPGDRQKDASDSESGDDIDDDYFEKETKDIQIRLKEVTLTNREPFTNMSIGFTSVPEFITPEDILSTADLPMKEKNLPESSKNMPLSELEAKAPQSRIVLPTLANDDSRDDSEAEDIEAYESIRSRMKTPPVSSLPFAPDLVSWEEDLDWQSCYQPPPGLLAFLANNIATKADQRQAEIEEQKLIYKDLYRNWILFHRSNDPLAVGCRERWTVAATQAAEVSRAASVAPPAEGRPEGRRAASRFATEHDIAMVLKASEKEAREQYERSNRAANARAASEKEAVIPNMLSKEERKNNRFPDSSRMIHPDRTIAALEVLPPVNNFTPEESEIFLKIMLEYPKQWGRIADALPKRSVKNVIQYYYLVKEELGLRDRLNPSGDKRKGRRKGKAVKPKASAIMTSLAARDNEDEATDAGDGVTERRGRPRRAAAPTFTFNNETAPSESDTTPAPPAGKRGAKGDAGSENAPTTGRRKAKATVPREKTSKQAKNSQLLAAAPNVAVPKPRDEYRDPYLSAKTSQAPSQSYPVPWDNNASLVASPFMNHPSYDKIAMYGSVNPEKPWLSGPYADEVRAIPPNAGTDQLQQDRRNLIQTSSYWSVPEQTDFPALLQHFGTDWAAIAKHMGSKTHIMVYTTVFQEWLSVAQDSNKSRRVANIEKQVKNYYQRQVDSGKTDLEDMARIADEKRSRGENTGPPPTPTMPIKRRYDGLERSHSALPPDAVEDVYASEQATQPLQHLSPRPNPISRFAPLTQVTNLSQPSMQPTPTTSNTTKVAQLLAPQTQNRPSRGPTLGFFTQDRERPVLQSATTYGQPNISLSDPVRSQRSQMVAQEAHLERQQALRIEEQNQARQQQLRLKQESELQNMSQLESYSAQPQQQHNTLAQARNETVSPIRDAMRRTSHLSQYRNVGDAGNVVSPISMSQIPAVARSTMSATPIHQEQPPAPAAQPPIVVAPPRPKTSSIMSLLNDEPSEPRPVAPPRPDLITSLSKPSASPAPQQSMYGQISRPLGHQSTHIRRESSSSDIRGMSMSYPSSHQPHTTSAPQPSIRLNESPYSAPGQAQSIRQQPGSPTGSAPLSERDFYPRQQFMMQHQQSGASPPQHNIPYQPPQPQQTNSRQLAFGTSSHHSGSPMTPYSSQASMHSARRSSIDGRQGPTLSASQAPTTQSYAPAPTQGASGATQYATQFQQQLQPSRFASHQAHSTSQTQPRLSQPLPPQRQRTPPTHPYGTVSRLAGPSRSYTPTYENRAYAPAPQQQSMERISPQDPETAIRRQILQQQRNSYSSYDRRPEDPYQRTMEHRQDEKRRE